MRNTGLFLRKYLRTPSVLFGAVLLLLVSSLGFGYDSLRETLPCAICSEEDSAEAEAVLGYLSDYDFVIYETREEVEAAVRSGTADCGAILREGFEEAMESGEMEGVCEFLLSSRTSLQSTYSLLLAGGILEVYTPYLTAQAFADEGYELFQEEVDAYFAQAMEEITALDFVIVDVEGNEVSEEPTILLPTGLIAIAGFTAYGFLAVACVRRPSEPVRVRFAGRSAYFRSAILPRLLSTGLLLLAATLIGIALGRRLLIFDLSAFALSVILYYGILTALFAGMILLPLPDHVLILIVAAEAAVSLVLCPLHMNIVLFVPQARVLRALDVPYWLYVLAGLS